MTSSETEKLTKSIKDDMQPDEEEKEDTGEDLEPMDIQNPFVHKMEWTDPYDRLRVSTTSFLPFIFHSSKVV